MKYGYINEKGILILQKIEEYRIQNKTITIEEQLKNLDSKYKIVENIDFLKLKTEKKYYTVAIKAYDTGEKISYKYEEQLSVQLIKAEINYLKKQLEKSDYKITKIAEEKLLGLELSYDLQEIRKEREGLRTKIKELEMLIKEEKEND